MLRWRALIWAIIVFGDGKEHTATNAVTDMSVHWQTSKLVLIL